MIKIKENSKILPIPTKEEYEENVADWGVNIPELFREFLEEYNCAEPIDLNIVAEGREHMVTRFLGIIDEDVSTQNNRYFDISCVQSSFFDIFLYDGDRFESDLVPFAELFGGDYLCLDAGKDRENAENPTVSVLSHEESGEFDPVTYHVADTFKEFVKKYNIL